jgi:hypothetical protein
MNSSQTVGIHVTFHGFSITLGLKITSKQDKRVKIPQQKINKILEKF